MGPDIAPDELKEIQAIARSAALSGYEQLSARFTRRRGFPSATPGYDDWKRQYLLCVVDAATHHLVLMDQADTHREEQRRMALLRRRRDTPVNPINMAHGVKYVITYRVGAQKFDRRAVVFYQGRRDEITALTRRYGPILLFKGNRNKVLELYRKNVKSIREADPTEPCMIGERA